MYRENSFLLNRKAGAAIYDDLPALGSSNLLLRDLIKAAPDALNSNLRMISFSPNEEVYCHGDEIRTVYFPIDSLFSTLAIMEDGASIETSMIGRESVVGLSVILGGGVCRNWVRSTVGGVAIGLRAEVLDQVFSHNDLAVRSLLRSYRALINQISQRSVCNAKHSVLERFCCWLLMMHDRIGDDNLKLTQENIASRLGSRRAGITMAAGMLQAMQAIEYRRGHIHIVDREVMEATVCECYSIMKLPED